jgi:hypothetical protein
VHYIETRGGRGGLSLGCKREQLCAPRGAPLSPLLRLAAGGWAGQGVARPRAAPLLGSLPSPPPSIPPSPRIRCPPHPHQERRLVRGLVVSGQAHLFKAWPRPGVRDEQKRRLLRAVADHLGASGGDLEAARLQVGGRRRGLGAGAAGCQGWDWGPCFRRLPGPRAWTGIGGLGSAQPEPRRTKGSRRVAERRGAPPNHPGGRPARALDPRQVLQPPVAPKRAHNMEMHNDLRVDEYYW